MKLVRYNQNPFRALDDIHKEINDLFGLSLWKDPFAAKGMLTPSLDMWEDEKNIYLEADAPGFEQKDIHVRLEGNRLTLSAQQEENKEEKKKGYYCCERYHGAFKRSVELPSAVDQSGIKARYKKGVLKISLPKKEEEKGKEISIDVE